MTWLLEREKTIKQMNTKWHTNWCVWLQSDLTYHRTRVWLKMNNKVDWSITDASLQTNVFSIARRLRSHAVVWNEVAVSVWSTYISMDYHPNRLPSELSTQSDQRASFRSIRQSNSDSRNCSLQVGDMYFLLSVARMAMTHLELSDDPIHDRRSSWSEI